MADYRGRKDSQDLTGERENIVDRAKAVKQKHVDRLKAFPNVIGVGVGHELVGGKRTDRVAIRVYVKKKLPKDQLAPDAILPDTLEGFPVDVIEDEFWIQQGRREANTFLVGGISVGNLLVGGAGTLGISVFDNRTGQELFLSNWHVLCFSLTCAAGEPIIQPGVFDGGTQADLVAHLFKAVLNADVDAAVALPLGQRPLFKEALEIGSVESFNQAVLGATARKSGRTTGVTVGTVADVSLDITIQGYPGGDRTFIDQIAIEGSGVSAKGDSGSVWLNENDEVIGLHFAGSSGRAIANHIDRVFTALDINLNPGMTVMDENALLAASLV
jgi:hypothetical protein